MRRLALVLALLLVPLPAFAQSAPPSRETQLEQRLRQRKTIVQTKASPEAMVTEANQAVDELASRQRRDDIVGELTRPGVRRPDLDQNVTGAIQSRNFQRALPR